jgi:two-component system, cell cycle sensor histidine kinase and response regulator CckA
LRDDFEAIREAAQRSADLTARLLAFARRQAVAPRVLDLNEAVSGALQLLRRLIGEAIELAWVPGAALWAVRMDPSQVDQILTNLCVNARDAIQGHGTIRIQTRNVLYGSEDRAGRPDCLPGEWVLLSVSDDGCGMDGATRARIFEPFFTTKPVGQGTGLGLSMVYGVVEQNNGFITVHSEPGRGTSFAIHLPRHAGEQPSTSAPEAVERLERTGQTILIVEDEPMILRISVTMLRKLGYTVLSASNAEEAVQIAQARDAPIDLLLTDVVMPATNGRELADRLRRSRPGLRCLFMSGYTTDVIATNGALERGAGFLPKPYTLRQLASAVRDALLR